MSEPSPVAGPSKPRFFFPPPFRISESRPPSTTSRSSTPLYLVPQRFRSVSVVSSRADEELRKKRTESVKRLRTTWELINEKYGSVLPEEDDEIDLRRGKVVKDRGWLRRQERREFGEISDRDEESSVLGGPETVSFDSDEDELGAWDERSGLDIQVPELEEEPSPPRRTQEDEDDLKAFLRAEVERKLALGDVPEEERSENSSSEDEGTGWTTSSWGGREDSLDALSPRLRRTRISVGLEDLFPADEDRMEEESEDELLRHDSDAEQAIQVVAATINHEETSPSNLPDHPLPGHADPRRSPSPPSLRSLFNTPPCDLAPATIQPGPSSPLTMSNLRIASAQTSSFGTRLADRLASANSDTGSVRNDDMRMKNFASSSTPYCPNVMHTRNGVTLRYCRPCQVAGGERAEKAAWCKGRGSPNYCTFEIQVENTEAHGSDDLDADAEASEIESDDSESDVDDSGSDADASESATDRCSPSTSSDDSVPASVLNPRLVDPRYMPSIICQWNSTSPRRCKHCRSAGGERADWAAWCRGRVTAKDCSFQQDDCNIRPTSYPARENEIQYESKGPRTPPLRSEVSPLNEPRHVLMCKLCRDAGSERARNAALCTGRLGKNRCRFESARTPSLIEEAAGDKHTPDRIRLAERLSLSDTPESQTNGSAETREPAVHSSGSGRVKRKRVILTPPPSSPAPEDNFDGRETAPPFSLALSLGSRLSAPSQESLKEAPNPSSPRTTIPLSIAARSHPLSSSMPPSSPPPRPDSPHPLIRLRDRPTPSPSLSAAPISSSPLAQLSVPPSSPPSKRSSNLDSLPVTMGPTPPPSTAGGRSCSASSDSVPLHFPPRRSSLRRTFDGANITTLSVKKARFSMHPRSPLQEPSSNPLMAGTPDDDELLLRDTSSMASSYTRSSPAYRYGSSPSPFSREMSVRAADVGLKLGPEHTGRLPFGMLAALAPSLSPSRGAHSLESAISQTSSMPSYALPTPPRSFGSSASSSSHFGSAGSPSKSTAGLMLPPPVPVKLLSFVRPLTPMEDPKPLPDIKFTTQSPALLRTHSRSLSVSVARTSRRQSFALVPNTTPRKRSRLERDLAKVARVAGDEAGLEWGMDEEVGEDLGRMWREGSVVRYLD